MIEKKNCTEIGTCIKAHGIKGELVIRLLSDWDINSFDTDFLFFDLDGGLVPFRVESIREKNDTDILVKLEDIEGEEKGAFLFDKPVHVDNAHISVETNDSIKPGGVTGFTAVDLKVGELGVIKGILEINNNPLFEIEYHNQELLIPVVEDFISEIDETNKKIIFDLPEGLIDLAE
ncbi:16S rRNA processing protein RimM [Marinilabiliaceae bacterium JC017]|nr:16S rRNA processing protein RimM [Marinilabiliaceae bacterium JC017]